MNGQEIPKLEAAMMLRREEFLRFGDPVAEAEVLVFHAAMREFQLIPAERRSPVAEAVVRLADARLKEALG